MTFDEKPFYVQSSEDAILGLLYAGYTYILADLKREYFSPENRKIFDIFKDVIDEGADSSDVEYLISKGIKQPRIVEIGIRADHISNYSLHLKKITDAYNKQQLKILLISSFQDLSVNGNSFNDLLVKHSDKLGEISTYSQWKDLSKYIKHPIIEITEDDEQPVILTIDGRKLLEVPGICGFVGAEGSGKSVIGEVLLSNIFNSNCDSLGFQCNAKKIHLFDTEMSQLKVSRLLKRALKRADVDYNDVKERLIIDCLDELPTVQDVNDWVFGRVATSDADLFVIDVLTDLIGDIIDSKEAPVLIRKLRAEMSRLNKSAIFTVHFNLGDKTGKPRGHIGAELKRKADSLLLIKHDVATGTRCITSNFSHGKVRLDKPDIEHYFSFNEELGYMSSSEKLAMINPKSKKYENLTAWAMEAFEDDLHLQYGELANKLMSITSKSNISCKKYIAEMTEAGVIIKGENYYTINMQDDEVPF